MNHTPGPWTLHAKHISGAYQITGAKGGALRIATITNAPNDQANALLIAAAPELLAALEYVVGFYDEWETSPVCNKARAAIANAKG